MIMRTLNILSQEIWRPLTEILFWNGLSIHRIHCSTILNGFRVSFGEDCDFLQIEENKIEVNETGQNIDDFPVLVELLESFSIINDENCGGFAESLCL